MNKPYTLKDHIRDSLKDPQFAKAWSESEVEYQLARQLIAKRLEKKLTQKALAHKAKTTQAIISRIETMNFNPSLGLLKRIVKSLDGQLTLAVR